MKKFTGLILTLAAMFMVTITASAATRFDAANALTPGSGYGLLALYDGSNEELDTDGSIKPGNHVPHTNYPNGVIITDEGNGEYTFTANLRGVSVDKTRGDAPSEGYWVVFFLPVDTTKTLSDVKWNNTSVGTGAIEQGLLFANLNIAATGMRPGTTIPANEAIVEFIYDDATSEVIKLKSVTDADKYTTIKNAIALNKINNDLATVNAIQNAKAYLNNLTALEEVIIGATNITALRNDIQAADDLYATISNPLTSNKIEDLVSLIEDYKGLNLTLNASGAINLEASIFNNLKDNDSELTVNIGKYAWTFIGANMTSNEYDKEVDLSISSTPSEGAKAAVMAVGAKGVEYINFGFSGELPGKVLVTVPVNYKSDANLKLYYINGNSVEEVDDSELKFVDGFVTFAIDHCSEYFLATSVTGVVSPKTGDMHTIITIAAIALAIPGMYVLIKKVREN